jgi:hypothetical protein
VKLVRQKTENLLKKRWVVFGRGLDEEISLEKVNVERG